MTRSSALLLVLLTTACGETQTPTAPTTPAGPPIGSPAGHVLSGVVLEATAQGPRPVEGAPVSAFVQEGDARSYRQSYFGRSSTDAEGRYRFSGMPRGFIVLFAAQSGYQRCAATIELGADATLDIEVVSEASLSAASPPRATTAGGPTLSGSVFETTAQGRRPVVGAYVGVEWSLDWVIATTRTDAEGRYSLCRLPTGLTVVGVGKSGYQAVNATAQVNGDTVLDLELKRP